MKINELVINSNSHDLKRASSAVLEAMLIKIRGGKGICDFDVNDWLDIVKASGYKLNEEELVKDAEKYIIQLVATINATAPIEVQEQLSVVRVMVLEQAELFRAGSITELEFLETCELICLEATVRAISNKVGEFSISLPLLGTVIEDTNCEMLYRMARKCLDCYEAQLIESYINKIRTFEKKLDEKYLNYVNAMKTEVGKYLDLVDEAFDVNSDVAFDGSKELANAVGVKRKEILKNKKEIDEFFK